MAMGGNAQASVLTAVERGDHAALEQAIKAGNKVDERNGEGQTALLVAVWNDDLDAARALIAEHGMVDTRGLALAR